VFRGHLTGNLKQAVWRRIVLEDTIRDDHRIAIRSDDSAGKIAGDSNLVSDEIRMVNSRIFRPREKKKTSDACAVKNCHPTGSTKHPVKFRLDTAGPTSENQRQSHTAPAVGDESPHKTNDEMLNRCPSVTDEAKRPN
jgi:hypothetical protein